MKGIYENKLGVRIEVIETNKDIFGNKYCTWRFDGTDKRFNISIESFKNMIKNNNYRKVSE